MNFETSTNPIAQRVTGVMINMHPLGSLGFLFIAAAFLNGCASTPSDYQTTPAASPHNYVDVIAPSVDVTAYRPHSAQRPALTKAIASHTPPAAPIPYVTSEQLTVARSEPATVTVRAQQSAPSKPQKTAAKNKPKKGTNESFWEPERAVDGPVELHISLANQEAYIYRNGVQIGRSTVSTGRKGYETPTGEFTILQKKKRHISNLYPGAKMPYMQRLTWDGIALHGGRVPGYPASHGCIRFPTSFAKKLFKVTDFSTTKVVIAADPSPPAKTEETVIAADPAPAAKTEETVIAADPAPAAKTEETVISADPASAAKPDDMVIAEDQSPPAETEYTDETGYL